jgi:hypothetical protein
MLRPALKHSSSSTIERERRKSPSSLSCRAQNLKSPFCTLKPMLGVCRPETKHPERRRLKWRRDGRAEPETYTPKQKVRKARNSGIFRPLCLLIAQFCGAHRRHQYIYTYTTVKRHQPNGGTPRLLVHYTQTHVGQVYKQPAAMAYMQMSVSSSETIGRSQRIVHAPTHDLSRVIEIDVVSARPPHDILDRNYCHALAAAWLCVCVCSASRQPNKYVFIQRYAASTPAERESGVCMGCARPLSCRQFMG